MGEVTFADINRDGTGVVAFASETDKEEALRRYNDYDYQGSKLIVTDSSIEPSGSGDAPRGRSPEPKSSRRSESPRRSPRKYDD